MSRKLTKKIRGSSDPEKTTDPCKNFATSAKSKSKEECKLGRDLLKSLKRAYPKWAIQHLGCTELLSTWVRAKWTLSVAYLSNLPKIECWKKYCGRWSSKGNRLSKLTRSLSRARKTVPPEGSQQSILTFSSLGMTLKPTISAPQRPDMTRMMMIANLSNWEMVKSCSLKPKFKN